MFKCSLQILRHVFLNTCGNVAFLCCLVELLACDVLVEFDVAVAYALGILVGNLRHLLSGLVHEVVLDKPLAYELLGELALWLACGEFLLVAVGIEIAAGVGSVDLGGLRNITITITELVL